MKNRIDSPEQKGQNMNWDEARNDWARFKGQVHARWQQLSDSQVEAIEGRREKLLEALHHTYGLDDTSAEQQVREFETGHDSVIGDAGRGVTERSREAGSGNQPPRAHGIK